MSGIIDAGNDRYIPSTKRPDGSFRKERKVRAGFTPQEDVVTYQPKGSRKSKDVGIVGMGDAAVKNTKVFTKAQIKNQKRKIKKQQEFQFNQNSLSSIVEALLYEMRLQDLSDIARYFGEVVPDQEPSAAIEFTDLKNKLVARIVKEFNQNNLLVGQKVFEIAKLPELRVLCGMLQLSETGDRLVILTRLQDLMRSRFEKIYTMDIVRDSRDIDSGNNINSLKKKVPVVHLTKSVDQVDKVVCEKKLKALNKKLRQIELLEKSNLETLLPEQVEKMKSKQLVQHEIESIQETLSKLELGN